MNFKWSELYREVFAAIADRSKVLLAVQQPDASSVNQYGDKQYGLYAKRMTRGKSLTYYVWVLCEIQDETYTVLEALLFPSSLAKNMDSMTPQEMLEAFLDEFGLVVKSEHKSAKLIYYDVAWHKDRKPGLIWTVESPSKSGIVSQLVKITPHGSANRVESAFVYAIDKSKYESWLQHSGFDR